MSEGPARLWGGRFAAQVDPGLDRYTASFAVDRRLARHDLVGTLAHVVMLEEVGVLDAARAAALRRGLRALLAEVESGRDPVEGPEEDVHTWIERRLAERVGEAAGWVHTGRSRNDQVATATRLYVREALERLVAAALALLERWLDDATRDTAQPLPGYTHLQRAQPVTLGHHWLAHAWALHEDLRRLQAAWATTNRYCPLGAGALAGSSHPLRPERTAALLGFAAPLPNSLFAVADRDFAAEALFAVALLFVHLSRWAEEVVLWTTAEFGFLALDDAVAKGSSLLPQKKNPEVAELVRGRAGRALGALHALLVTLKGLPLAYNSDLQEDKEHLLGALDLAEATLRAAARLQAGLRPRPERMRAALHAGFLTATAVADALVRRGVPFRTAHARVGALVRAAEEQGVELWQLDPATAAALVPELPPEELAALTPEAALAAHATPGGPTPASVHAQIDTLAAALAEGRRWLAARTPPPVLTHTAADAPTG